MSGPIGLIALVLTIPATAAILRVDWLPLWVRVAACLSLMGWNAVAGVIDGLLGFRLWRRDDSAARQG